VSCLSKKHTQESTSVHMRPKVDWKWLKPSCSDKKNTHCKLFGTAKAQQQMRREKQTTQPENPVMKNPKDICWPFQYEILIFLISVWYPPKVRLKFGRRKHWQNMAKSDLLKAMCADLAFRAPCDMQVMKLEKTNPVGNGLFSSSPGWQLG